jgi:hypothetical protein
MPFLKICVALYDYEANTEEELTIKENDILYILEDDDPEWWKAKLKTADPSENLIGLIPCNYVEPVSQLPFLHTPHAHTHTHTLSLYPAKQGSTDNCYRRRLTKGWQMRTQCIPHSSPEQTN